MVSVTVLLVLALAAWAMIDSYHGRPSALPRAGVPIPEISAVDIDPSLEAELSSITDVLTRRETNGEVVVEAVYNTREMFEALGRYQAALQETDEADSLVQAYRRDHELDRYFVFTLILGSNGLGLTEYQPEAMARLRTPGGREVSAVSWVELPSSSSDYARVGMLHFPRTTIDGQPLLSNAANQLELVLSSLAQREWVLCWDLPIAYSSPSPTALRGCSLEGGG